MQGRHRLRPPVIVATIGMVLGLGLPGTVLAAVTVDLDQWASSDAAWQNGNLNGNNSRYPEGGIVPFRLALEGLKPGAHSIHINYDFTAGGHKAYDFLATWNVTNAKGKVCIPSGGAISSMCPSLPGSSSAAFPSDPFKANGLSVKGRRGLLGRAPSTHDLGRDDHLDQRAGARRFRERQQHGGHPRAFPLDEPGRAPRLGRAPRPVSLLGYGRRRSARWRLPRVRRAVAHADAPTRWGGQPEPGSEHPAERDRRRAAAPGARTDPAGSAGDAATAGNAATAVGPDRSEFARRPRGPLATVPPTSTVEPRVVTGSPTAGLILAIALGTMLVGLSIASGWRRRTRPPD